ncbi:MAG TPA: hypothetical protein VFY14_13685 [Streptomyces sp.]|nr:hypothetical protein [Streptomyces sp.]
MRVSTAGGTVTLTEHDEHPWVGRDGQRKAGSAVRDVLATWRYRSVT